MSTVGSRIRCAREALNITQEQLGKLCGTTKQTIFKYENDIVANIPMERIKAIALHLHITPAYLLGWSEDKSTPTAPEYDEGTEKLIAAILELPPEKKKALADLMGIDYE